MSSGLPWDSASHLRKISLNVLQLKQSDENEMKAGRPLLTSHRIPHSVCASAQAGLLSAAGSAPKLAALKEHWWSLAGAQQRQRRWRREERSVGRWQKEQAEGRGWQWWG